MLSVRSVSPAPAYESIVGSEARESQYDPSLLGTDESYDTASESRAPAYATVDNHEQALDVAGIPDPFVDVDLISTYTALESDTHTLPAESQTYQDIRVEVRASTSTSREAPLNADVLAIVSHTFNPDELDVVLDELERRLKYPEDNNCSLVKALTLAQILMYCGASDFGGRLLDVCDALERLVVYPVDIEAGVDCGSLVRTRAGETLSLIRGPASLGQSSALDPVSRAPSPEHEPPMPPGCLSRFTIGDATVKSAIYLEGDMQVACLQKNGGIRIFNILDSSEKSVALTGPASDGGSSIHCFAALPYGQRLVAGTLMQTLHMWDLETDEHRTLQTQSAVRAVSVDQSGTYVVAATADGVILWDLHGDTLEGPFSIPADLTSISRSTQNSQFACGASDGTVFVWDLASRFVVAGPLKSLPDDIVAVACSTDGATVAVASSFTIAIWDISMIHLPEPKTFKLPHAHSSPIADIAISPSGAQVASSSADKTIRLWDALTGDLLRVFEGHTGPVSSVCFSADGVQILSASSDRSVRIWDALSTSAM